METALWNFIWENVIEALYRWKGDVRGQPGPPHHGLTHPRCHLCHHLVWLPLAPL
jgi:hypothetical protein